MVRSIKLTQNFLFLFPADAPKLSLQNVFIGLAVVAGILLLMFVVVTSYNGYRRRKMNPKYGTELH